MEFDLAQFRAGTGTSPRVAGSVGLGLHDKHSGLAKVRDAGGEKLAVAFYRASAMSPEEYQYFTEKYRPRFKEPSISDERKDQLIIVLHKVLKTIIVQAKNDRALGNSGVLTGKDTKRRSLSDSGHGTVAHTTHKNRDPLTDKGFN